MNTKEHVYGPGETILVHSDKEAYTRYIAGFDPEKDLPRSKFHSDMYSLYEGRRKAALTYELDLYYKLLTQGDFFGDFMGLHGEVLGCPCLPNDYCHGVAIVDLLTYGYEKNTDRSPDDVSNDDDWLIDYVKHQLQLMDSSDLPSLGIAYRARLEENIANREGEIATCQFAFRIEEMDQ